MEKVSNVVPASSSVLTPEQIAHYQQLRDSIEARVTAIFNIWNQLRHANEDDEDCCRDNCWEGVIDWCIVENEVHVQIDERGSRFSIVEWGFQTTLLYVGDEELESATSAAFSQWLEEERQRP